MIINVLCFFGGALCGIFLMAIIAGRGKDDEGFN